MLWWKMRSVQSYGWKITMKYNLNMVLLVFTIILICLNRKISEIYKFLFFFLLCMRLQVRPSCSLSSVFQGPVVPNCDFIPLPLCSTCAGASLRSRPTSASLCLQLFSAGVLNVRRKNLKLRHCSVVAEASGSGWKSV